MTVTKLIFFSFLQWVFYTLLKVWFFRFWSPEYFFHSLLYWLVVAVIAAALVRRIGVINYLESFFLVIVWLLSGLLMDLLVTAIFTGLQMFGRVEYWVGYFVMFVAIVLFHKKRHIQVRKELHAKHHH